jgi:hypothetical protein
MRWEKIAMKGIEFGEIRDAIVAAFNPAEFDMFLYERLDFERAVEVADGPFRVVVTKVLQIAQQEGWDPILVAEVAVVRPMKRDIQEVYKKYAQALVDEGRKHGVDASQLEAIEKYRLGPTVMVQTGGTPKGTTSVSATQDGLEKAVKPYLPYIDVSTWREQLLKLEGCVCRVEVRNRAIGTGFLVGPEVVLTNYHVLREVIETPTSSATVKLRFDYRVLPNGTRSDGTLVSLHATEWLVDFTPYTAAEAHNNPDADVPTIDQLDFVLVKLERAFGKEPLVAFTKDSSPRGWIDIPTEVPLIRSNPPMPIFILQHPNAEPLKLAVDTAGVLNLYDNGTRVRYATNTEPGSSGSPCFDIDWKLVALHHYGDPLHDKAQFNQGIPVNMIRDRLRRVGQEGMLGRQVA